METWNETQEQSREVRTEHSKLKTIDSKIGIELEFNIVFIILHKSQSM